MNPPSNIGTEEREARLAEELKHTLKLVPESQRELFVFELAKWYEQDRQTQRRLLLERVEEEVSYMRWQTFQPVGGISNIKYVQLSDVVDRLRSLKDNQETCFYCGAKEGKKCKDTPHE